MLEMKLGDTEILWTERGHQKMFKLFKDLILQLFSYNGDNRPQVDAIRNHPSMQSSTFNYEATRTQLLQTLGSKQSIAKAASTQPMTKPVKVKRSAPMV